MISRVLVLLAATLVAVPHAWAEDVYPLGNFKKNWDAYFYPSPDGAWCFALSKAKSGDSSPAALLYLTHRPSVRNEINVVVEGYEFQPDVPVVLTIDEAEFVLFSKKRGAWQAYPERNAELEGAMRGGNNLVVTGTSTGGKPVSETFSLIGLTDASKAIAAECRRGG